MVSIEGIDLEQFSATYQEKSSSSLNSLTNHDVFNLFLSDNSKQYAAKTAAHIKRIVELLEKQKVLGAGVITI